MSAQGKKEHDRRRTRLILEVLEGRTLPSVTIPVTASTEAALRDAIIRARDVVDAQMQPTTAVLDLSGLTDPYGGPHCLDQKMAILRYCFVRAS